MFSTFHFYLIQMVLNLSNHKFPHNFYPINNNHGDCLRAVMNDRLLSFFPLVSQYFTSSTTYFPIFRTWFYMFLSSFSWFTVNITLHNVISKCYFYLFPVFGNDCLCSNWNRAVAINIFVIIGVMWWEVFIKRTCLYQCKLRLTCAFQLNSRDLLLVPCSGKFTDSL